MSIKIHNGYKIEKMSLDDLHKWCLQIGDELKDKSKELFHALFAKYICEEIDLATVGLGEGNTSHYNKLCSEMLNLNAEVTHRGIRHQHVDYSFQMVLIPKKNYILANIFTEHYELIQLFAEKKQVLEYPYWNNSDPPDNLTYEEWSKRGKEWTDAVSRVTWDQSGFTFTATPEGLPAFPEKEKILKLLPSFKERCNYTAKHMVRQNELDKLKEKENLWSKMSKIERWINGDDGKKAIEKKVKKIEQQLKRELTIEDIT